MVGVVLSVNFPVLQGKEGVTIVTGAILLICTTFLLSSIRGHSLFVFFQHLQLILQPIVDPLPLFLTD